MVMARGGLSSDVNGISSPQSKTAAVSDGTSAGHETVSVQPSGNSTRNGTPPGSEPSLSFQPCQVETQYKYAE